MFDELVLMLDDLWCVIGSDSCDVVNVCVLKCGGVFWFIEMIEFVKSFGI